MAAAQILNTITKHGIKFVDLRFTDTIGKEQHISIAAGLIDNDFFTQGKMFDGSSIAGWRTIDHSDMQLLPDVTTAIRDPFAEEPTLIIRCNVVDPISMQLYDRCPRSVAQRAEQYLQSTGIADACFVGPEPEFFLFDGVRWNNQIGRCMYEIESGEAFWNSAKKYEQGNMGHRPGLKGGYFPVPPVDSSQDIRTAMSITMEAMGLTVEAHHHEVATANQNEICTRFNSLLRKADEMQIYKYVVHNVAHSFGKTATFMPKPLVGDNGSGMHCHQSLAKDGQNLFSGDGYGGLSEMALFYIGGIIKHAKALCAFTNPTTNSYKRLVPGFEAPVMLAYSACNRSAAIRIPYTPAKGRRIEVRFPDPMANPYLAFSAMLMAGLDGIKNKIHPGEPHDQDLYELSPKESKKIPAVAHTLEHALEALDNDREFLLAGDVFSNDLITSYIKLKQRDVQAIHQATHPLEFEMYYSG